MKRYTVTNLADGSRTTCLAASAEEAATRARDYYEVHQRAFLLAYPDCIGDCAHTAVADDDPADTATVRFGCAAVPQPRAEVER